MRRGGAVTVAGFIGTAAFLAFAAACGGSDSQTPPTASPSQSPDGPTSGVYADTPLPVKPAKANADPYARSDLAAPLWDFGLDLLARQAAKSGDNLVVSPVSLEAVLSMTLSGARGETAAQMSEALRLKSLEPQQANQAWADLIAASNATQRAEVRIADSLWLREGVPYVPSFLAANRDYFAADTRNLSSDLAGAPAEINAWVSERTGGRIEDLISVVPPATLLVLVNTVCAKVGWEHFDASQTEEKPFTLANGTEVQVPTMRGLLRAEVAVSSEYTAVPVDTNGELTFWVVVPKGAQTPESVATLLRERGLGSLRKDATSAEVDLQLPRFRIEYDCKDLVGDLKAMGMRDAFSSEAADFSGMADVPSLWIGAVIQKAMIDVNEEGVEAAAGSAVIMVGSAAQPKKISVRADRPFLAVLTGNSTDAPLFMALVRDPR